ncbi:MAG: branched-chain amino acid ABC transporter permease [Actinobacteria bacterium]|uniref:Unannotated protein n=1 Tax=freshwater metagenome TaxID=449393 RepID=A0A6J7KZH0_9ZZZZ|nr:branched-chain amino acid ABC transporter permease [Actinomycetota bacterium]
MVVIQALIDALSFGSTYVLLGLGLSLVFSVLGLVNFSFGALIVWGGLVLVTLTGLGFPYWVAVLAMVVILTLISILTAKVAFQPFHGAPPATLLLSSFGVALILQAIAFIFFGQGPYFVETPRWLSEQIQLGSLSIGVLQIVTIAACVGVILVLQALLYHTSGGVQIRAVAESAQVAELMGIRSGRIFTMVFALSGAIAGVVAFLWFAKLGTASSVGDLNITLKAFIVVVIGGLGTLRGAVVGGLLLGAFEAFLFTFTPAELSSWQQTCAFLLVTLVLLIRPQGIMGQKVELSR